MVKHTSSIRARREALGLSQTDAAKGIGVSRSYLSLVESGSRTLQEHHARALAGMLEMPAEMLLLECGQLPHDVRNAIEVDAAAATTAIRSHVEHDAAMLPDAPASRPTANEDAMPDLTVAERAIPLLIEDTKASVQYRAHSYHTKVPPAAIAPFINAFSEPGQWVADPFCGSGMTGVAALTAGRNALLSDLSPAAVHIARNYTEPCDPIGFKIALQAVEAAVRPTMRWLYGPPGGANVEYTTWSDVFRCGTCQKEIVYWEVFERMKADMLPCPHCGTFARKAALAWAGEKPVVTHVTAGANRVSAHAPTPAELDLIDEIDAAPIPYWTPHAAFSSEREMWRAAHREMGVTTAADFFTRRNLHALAALRHAIVTCAEGRLRAALLFAFTACVNRASKRYQWNAKRPTNVMTGTLYISSLRYEWNVWSLFRRKAADVLRYYSAFPKTEARAQVFQSSATGLDCIDTGSVDFVFMDPPFGSNIFYADSSLLWDAWLGTLTDQAGEMVVNKKRTRPSGGKDLDDYGLLMTDAFGEVARMLRPGGRSVLAFSNSDDRVWSTVQDALSDAGLDVRGVHLLDKGQPSIKGVKGKLGIEQVTRLDLMLVLGHRSRPARSQERATAGQAFIEASVRTALRSGARRLDHVYSLVLRGALQSDLSTTGIKMPAVAAICATMAEQDADGLWQPFEQDDRAAGADMVVGYLATSDDLPTSRRTAPPPESAPRSASVKGGRGSPFYLAHSYHTKVPPEAITPFIDHFTRPGDVVLDPFAGSGMTGVAASMAGRRAILNDLSPAAVHLAWNHTRGCDPTALSAAFERMAVRIGGRIGEMYSTTDENGDPATVRWTVWSTRHRCPDCGTEFQLWDTVDTVSGRVGRETRCGACGARHDRSRFVVTGNVPAWISLQRRDGSRGYKKADADDVRHAASFRHEDVRDWYPDVPLGPDREMYQRCALHLQGIGSVADMYTGRNLQALSLIWSEIQSVEDTRIRRALTFAFTNTAWHGTRMRRFNARGGHRPLTGTLYVPNLSSEANVLEVMRKKVKQLGSYYRTFVPTAAEDPAVLLGSATRLDAVASGSVDYVFTDPPFGSNIFYADCNLIWEAWLGRITDATMEAVVNKSLAPSEGGKSIDRYADLMAAAMREMFRVLKPGGWATVVFHNTDSSVWEALSDAAAQAGFEFHNAGSLDRQQQSHKGYKGRSGEEDVAHFDVVMNLRRPATSCEAVSGKVAAKRNAAWDLGELVEMAALEPGVAAKGVQGIHAEVMRRLVSVGADRFPDFSAVRKVWERRSATDDQAT